MHQARRLPEDRIDVLGNVFGRDAAKRHLERQLQRLHLGDELPQEEIAKTSGALCAPGKNQDGGAQCFLLTCNKAPGPGLADDHAIPAQFVQ